MILDTSDFDDRPYRIPNQEESRDFIEFIEQKEEEILTQLFGYQFFNELNEAINSSGELPQIWLDFRDGCKYDSGGKTYNYRGLVYLLVPAIYSLWIDKNAMKFTNIGYVNNNAPQQSTPIDNEPFVVQAWNDYCARTGGSCAANHRFTWNHQNTFWGFYSARKTDYPDLVYNAPERKNRFGF